MTDLYFGFHTISEEWSTFCCIFLVPIFDDHSKEFALSFYEAPLDIQPVATALR